MAERFLGLDAYSPAQVAHRVESQGVTKAHLRALPMLMLGVVGGGFIGLGAMFQTVVAGDPDLNPGAARIIGGIVFAMGYLIAMTAGAEVFTTNNLVVMSWAARRISTRRLLKNWGLVLLANTVGAVGLGAMVLLARHPAALEGAVGEQVVAIGAAKAAEPFMTAFFKGILGNLLICTGVWIGMAGRSVTDKFIGPLLPIAALPIANFEHSVGNLYYIPTAMMVLATSPGEFADVAIPWWGAVRNLTAVTLGNILGGSVMVALMYHLIYRRALPTVKRKLDAKEQPGEPWGDR